mgnify:CR=1 FL=1
MKLLVTAPKFFGYEKLICKEFESRGFDVTYVDDKLKLNFINGNHHGIQETYHPNGNIRQSVDYIDGKRVNTYKEWYPDGTLAIEAHYLNGKKEGVSEIFSLKGVVLKHLNYANDTLHGLSKSYNGKGELLSEGQFKKGKKTGIWSYYKNNKLIDKKDFTYYPKFQKSKKQYK